MKVLIVLLFALIFHICLSSCEIFELNVVDQNSNIQTYKNLFIVPSPDSPDADDDDDDCLRTRDYVSKGGKCDGDLMPQSETNGCSYLKGSPSCCAQGLYCVNSICAIDNVGATCKYQSDCFPDVVPFVLGSDYYPIDCINGVCKYLAGPGDSCTITGDCANSVPCVNGVCSGLTTGVKCNYTSSSLSQCAFDFYCSLGFCTPTVGLNASCSSDSQCSAGLFCGNDDKCVYTFSTSVGESCSKSNNYECKVGYTCLSGHCAPITPSIIHCEHSNQCTSGSCSCQSTTGTSYCTGSVYNYDPCTQERSDYYGCLATNLCSTISNQQTSCSYSKCKSVMDKLSKCTCGVLKDQAGDIYYCNAGFATWKLIVSIVVPVVGILLIVIIVVVLVVSCRKHKDYEQI